MDELKIYDSESRSDQGTSHDHLRGRFRGILIHASVMQHDQGASRPHAKHLFNKEASYRLEYIIGSKRDKFGVSEGIKLFFIVILFFFSLCNCQENS